MRDYAGFRVRIAEVCCRQPVPIYNRRSAGYERFDRRPNLARQAGFDGRQFAHFSRQISECLPQIAKAESETVLKTQTVVD